MQSITPSCDGCCAYWVHLKGLIRNFIAGVAMQKVIPSFESPYTFHLVANGLGVSLGLDMKVNASFVGSHKSVWVE